MVLALRWTPQALEEFNRVMETLAKSASQYASEVASQVIRITRLLKRFPRIGRRSPDSSDPNIREMPLGRYMLVYRIREKEIVIYAFVPTGTSVRL